MWISRENYESLIHWLIKNETEIEKLKTKVVRLEYLLKDELRDTLGETKEFINAFYPVIHFRSSVW